MPTAKITKRLVDSTRAPETGEVVWWDQTVEGFGLRLRAGRRGAYIVQYRNAEGRSRKLALGSVGRMTPTAARKAAKKYLGRVEDGHDPAEQRKEQRRGDTFGELARTYLELHARKRKRSAKQDEYLLEANVLPTWRGRKLKGITRNDVTVLLDRIDGRGSPVVANRVKALVSKVFNFALDRGQVDANPAARMKDRARTRKGKRALGPDEVGQLYAVLEADGSPMARSFQLRLLTGQRPGEVAAMAWRDLDLEAGWWTIPGDQRKAHRLDRDQPTPDHRVHLAPEARTVLAAVVRDPDSPYVFPSPKASTKPMRSWRKALERYKAAMEEAAVAELTPEESAEIQVRPFTAHELRHTVATRMAEDLGVPRVVVSRVLGHSERSEAAARGGGAVAPEVTALYDHSTYDRQAEDAWRRWGRRVAELAGLAEPEAGAEVVEINSARRAVGGA